MKVQASTIVARYNGKPVMIEQEILRNDAGQPVIVNGTPLLSDGREMTVGDVISSILCSKKVTQFNVLKADVLARRFYLADVVDVDEGDLSGLVEVIEHNDQFMPFVLAYAKRALIEARDGQDRAGRNKN
jgi:hypothetical protein